MFVQGNALSRSRIGVIVSRKTAARAVDRNRIKRMVRETFRQKQAGFTGNDLVVLARRCPRARAGAPCGRARDTFRPGAGKLRSAVMIPAPGSPYGLATAILFFAFSFSVFLLLDAWQRDQQPPPSTVAADEAAPAANPTPTPSEKLAGTQAAVPKEVGPARVQGATVQVETDLVVAHLNTLGGDLRRLELKQHREHARQEQGVCPVRRRRTMLILRRRA